MVVFMRALGQEDYDRLRPLSYANANVFVLCFSVGSRASWENVRDKWAPELRRHAPHTPILLVGTQADRRDPDAGADAGSSSSRLVTEAEGWQLARTVKAAGYLECSAKSRAGVKAVFSEAVLVALDPERARANMKRGRKGCVIQ